MAVTIVRIIGVLLTCYAFIILTRIMLEYRLARNSYLRKTRSRPKVRGRRSRVGQTRLVAEIAHAHGGRASGHLSGNARLKKAVAFFVALTEPYTRLFRWMRFLHEGPIDFTPLAGLVGILAIQIALGEWMRRGAKSSILLPVFLASALLNICSLIALGLFFILIARVILLKIGVIGVLTDICDRLVMPMISRGFRLLRIKRAMPFAAQLLLLAAGMLALFFGLRFMSVWLFLL